VRAHGRALTFHDDRDGQGHAPGSGFGVGPQRLDQAHTMLRGCSGFSLAKKLAQVDVILVVARVHVALELSTVGGGAGLCGAHDESLRVHGDQRVPRVLSTRQPALRPQLSRGTRAPRSQDLRRPANIGGGADTSGGHCSGSPGQCAERVYEHVVVVRQQQTSARDVGRLIPLARFRTVLPHRGLEFLDHDGSPAGVRARCIPFTSDMTLVGQPILLRSERARGSVNIPRILTIAAIRSTKCR
jgi:hypothetical protein